MSQEQSVRDVIGEHKPKTLEEQIAEIKSEAKRNCKHCYGTGFLGARVLSATRKEMITCVCVVKARNLRQIEGENLIEGMKPDAGELKAKD